MPEYKIVDKLYPTIDEFQCPDYRCKDGFVKKLTVLK